MYKKGFTLLEIVVSLAILALGLLGIFSLIPTGVDQTQRSQAQAKAVILSQSKMEELMSLAARDWENFNTSEHFFSENDPPPFFIGPNTVQEKEMWGWKKGPNSTWIDDIGFQWVWDFEDGNPADGEMALITLTVSWPQKYSQVGPKFTEQDLKVYYTQINDNSIDYFKTNDIKYVRLISYVSKEL